MNTDLDAMLRRAISRELERHCTDAELEAHAAQQLSSKPLVQAWVRDHLSDCVDCRARVPLARPSVRHWDQLGDMLRRTLTLECGLDPAGALRMRGAEPYRPNDVTLSSGAALEVQGEVELPNGVHVVVQVVLCDPARPLYEVRAWSKDGAAQGQMALTEAYLGREPASGSVQYLDLERVIIRGKLGYAAAMRVGPGLRSLGFSFAPGGSWYVVPLSLGPVANANR
jgi:hypothetical protein